MNYRSPIVIPFHEEIVNVSIGDFNSLMVGKSGKVYAFGLNKYGALGLGEIQRTTAITEVPLPEPFDVDDKIVSASCGGSHVTVVTEFGNLYASGRNYHGALGLGDRNDRHTLTHVITEEPIIHVSTGSSYSLALGQSGHIYVCGFNEKGQLGVGDQEMRISLTKVPSFRLFSNQTIKSARK